MQVSNIVKGPVLLFWMKRYLNLMLFSMFFRVAGCVYFYKLFVTNGFSELVKCFAIGFIFDSCVASVILAFIFLLTAVFSFKKSLFNKLFVVSLFLILVFNVFNFLHLVNFGVCFNYYTLKQLNSTVIQTILVKPQFYFVLFGLLFCFLIINNFISKYAKPAFEHWKRESALVVVLLFTTSFLFLPFPFYYYCNISANSIINELPKNGMYCYVSSVQTTLSAADLIIDSEQTNLEEAIQTVAGNLSNVSEITNGKIIRLVEPDTNFTRYKHIILIIMESMGSNMFNDTIAPHLFKFKNEGIYYTKCKATGPRTQMGVASLLTGVPNIVGVNYYRRKGIYKIETLADYLTPLNYNCYYLHNGYLDYDNLDKLMLQGGFKNLIDAKSITNYKLKNSWGLDDEALFIKGAEHIKQTRHLKTFHVLQSITNHEPFDIPRDFIIANKQISKWSKKLQTYYYADCMLGKFLNELKARSDFDSSLVFITGDHGEAYNDNEFSYNVFHVPLIVLNGKLTPQTINYDCSHIDVPFTILSACGYNKKTVMFGENLFSLKPDRVIVSTNYNTEVNLKRHDTLYRYCMEKQDERIFKLNIVEMEESEINDLSTEKKAHLRKVALSHYKVVRDYLLSGKINR